MEVRDGRQPATGQDSILCQVDKGYLTASPEVILLGGLLLLLRRNIRLWLREVRLAFIGLRLCLRAMVYGKSFRLSVVLLVLRL